MAHLIRPDFAGNAERLYRRGYALMIRGMMGALLTPDEKAAAARACYTQQRRLNEALGGHPALAQGGPWEPWHEVSTR